MVQFKLRPWTMEDADRLPEYANNYNIARFLTDGFPHPYTKDDAIAFLSSIVDIRPVRIMAIEIDGNAVGSIGITPQSDIHRKNAEMGYYLAEPYWGKGIMTRVIREMLDYGFRTFDVTRIFARPFGTNRASQRVLEKAGFVFEVRFKNALFKEGKYIDELYYGITLNRFQGLEE